MTPTPHQRALALADASFGVVSRATLAAAGITRHVVRRQVEAGRWAIVGPQAVHILGAPTCSVRTPICAAVLNAGPKAWVDGEAALLLAGFRGWAPRCIDIGLPRTSRTRPPAVGEVVHHWLGPPRIVDVPVARAHPVPAALRAASWAPTPRAAGTLLAMVTQQRLVRPADLVTALEQWPKLRRRRLLRTVLMDIVDGAQSLSELDFAALCRARGLPCPSRQVLRQGPRGRMYLDARWDEKGLVVEIDGAHHFLGDNPTRDALRQNELALQGDMVLRVPAIALRTDPDPFFEQIRRVLCA